MDRIKGLARRQNEYLKSTSLFNDSLFVEKNIVSACYIMIMNRDGIYNLYANAYFFFLASLRSETSRKHIFSSMRQNQVIKAFL
jgi:hypothetical protein